jgi:hypothetical protein
MQTVLGPIVTADEVCVAVEDTLKAWLPAMFAAMGVADQLEAPKSWRQVPTVEALREAAMPSAGTATPGWSTEPERDEDGNLQITWRVNVLFFVRGDDYEQTQRHTRLYAAAASTVLMQQHTLLGFATATDVVSETYEPINDGARTLGGALIEVDVTVSDARNDVAAQDGLPPAPLPDLAVADSVTVTVVQPVTT